MYECQVRLLIIFAFCVAGAVEVSLWLTIPATIALIVSILLGYDKNDNW